MLASLLLRIPKHLCNVLSKAAFYPSLGKPCCVQVPRIPRHTAAMRRRSLSQWLFRQEFPSHAKGYPRQTPLSTKAMRDDSSFGIHMMTPPLAADQRESARVPKCIVVLDECVWKVTLFQTALFLPLGKLRCKSSANHPPRSSSETRDLSQGLNRPQTHPLVDRLSLSA